MTRQDRRRARPSSSASARRWDGLDSCERRGSVATGDGFIIDSLPAPAFVRRRARAWRCRKAPGRECCGECAAKREKFFGWRVQLVCRPDGVPVHVPMLPTPPNPPACGGDWGGCARPRFGDSDNGRRRRQVFWRPSRASRADHARAPLLTRQDRRLALPSSSPSARRWDDLDSRERQGSVATDDGFLIDSLPAPAFVHRRARARRGRKAPGRTPDGCCAAKRETFVG